MQEEYDEKGSSNCGRDYRVEGSKRFYVIQKDENAAISPSKFGPDDNMPHGSELLIEALFDGGAEVHLVLVALAGLVDDLQEEGLHLLVEVLSNEPRLVFTGIRFRGATADCIHASRAHLGANSASARSGLQCLSQRLGYIATSGLVEGSFN